MLDNDTHHALRGEIQTLRNVLFVAKRRQSSGEHDPQSFFNELEAQITKLEERCNGAPAETTPPSAITTDTRQIAVLRHDLRNKLMAVRNAALFIRRSVEATELAKEARVVRFLGIIDGQLEEAEKMLVEK